VSSDKTAPKHRASKARRAPKAALKTSLTLSSMAVVATGFAVGTGQLALGGGTPDAPAVASADITGAAAPQSKQLAPQESQDAESSESSETPSAETGATRDETVTRSSDRTASASAPEADESADPSKVESLSQVTGNAVARTEDLSGEDPRTIAKALLSEFGFGQDQFGCLDSLWTRESGWNPSADNPTSSAYGIPQALPGSKMASAGSDWATNPVTQIRWGLGYIADRYGSPCSAWGHSQATGFY
jgi:hypothetical protein